MSPFLQPDRPCPFCGEPIHTHIGWDQLEGEPVVCIRNATPCPQADGGVSADQLQRGPDPQSRHQADGGK
jgi:hypothetical protein